MLRSRYLYAVLVASVAMASDPSSPGYCPPSLQCFNDGPCAPGNQTYVGHPVGADGEPFDFTTDNSEISRDGYHCDCPSNRTGLRCNRIFEECGRHGHPTGHRCYHGGRCIENIQDVYENFHTFCDCSNAELDGVKYVGKFCESPIEVSRCDEDDPGQFCLNGGHCKRHVDQVEPCRCEDGFTGTHCEFNADQVPECTLQCQNSGACRLGVQSYEDFTNGYDQYDEFFAPDDQINFNYQYCDCQEGFFGNLCEKQFDACDVNDDFFCLHGSQCLQTEDGTKYCDCNAANTPDKHYAGRSCQYESNEFCSDPGEGLHGRQFCVNGGTCGDDPLDPCTCPIEFNGPRCEFRRDDPEDQEQGNQCKLDCLNGGECKEGAFDFASIVEIAPDLVDSLESHSEDFEHCACPDGWGGLTCEIQIQVCGEGEHMCLHGSTCVKDGDEHLCLCDATEQQTAGLYCEHLAMVSCPGAVNGNRGFCVNDGECVPDTSGRPHCKCGPDFEGPHCEYRKGKAPKFQSLSSDKGISPGGILALVVVGVVGLSLAIFFAKRRGKKAKDEVVEIHSNTNLKDFKAGQNVIVRAMDEDFDTTEDTDSGGDSGETVGDGEMKTVEII